MVDEENPENESSNEEFEEDKESQEFKNEEGHILDLTNIIEDTPSTIDLSRTAIEDIISPTLEGRQDLNLEENVTRVRFIQQEEEKEEQSPEGIYDIDRASKDTATYVGTPAYQGETAGYDMTTSTASPDGGSGKINTFENQLDRFQQTGPGAQQPGNQPNMGFKTEQYEGRIDKELKEDKRRRFW